MRTDSSTRHRSGWLLVIMIGPLPTEEMPGSDRVS